MDKRTYQKLTRMLERDYDAFCAAVMGPASITTTLGTFDTEIVSVDMPINSVDPVLESDWIDVSPDPSRVINVKFGAPFGEWDLKK